MMYIYRYFSYLLILSFTLLSSANSYSHVKWFVDSDTADATKFVPYTLNDPEVLIWTGIGLFLVFCSILLDKWIPTPQFKSTKLSQYVIDILRVCVGLSLLLTAYDGSLIAPHYEARGGFGVALLILQSAVGIMFIVGRSVFHASILTLILYLGVVSQVGVWESLDYVNIVGIAIFLMFNYFPSREMTDVFKPYALPFLRIFTGLALVILGVSEKLLGAHLGQMFLATYDWNFMTYFGIEIFSDRLFVLSAGVMEVVFGVILIFGTLTRINTLVISIFMLTSNITFLLQSNNSAALLELIGHMPVIATALVLLLEGSGQRLGLTSLFVRVKRVFKPEPAFA